MKKQKKIFIIVFVSLLTILSVMTLSLYDNVKENMLASDDLAYYLNDDLQLLTIAKAKEVDPSYEPISFGEGIDEESKQIFLNLFNKYLNQIVDVFNNDAAFVYTVKNTVTNETSSGHQDLISSNDDISKYGLYTQIKYDEIGNALLEGDVDSYLFSRLNVEQVLSTYVDHDGNDMIYVGNWMFDTNEITVNPPKNIEITYIIPQMDNYSGYASQYLNAWTNYNFFSLYAMLGCGGILVLFFLFYPINIVEMINPFLTVKKWKAEINLPLLSGLVFLGGLGVMIVMGNSLNGYFLDVLMQYKIPSPQLVVNIVNFVVFTLELMVISLAAFVIKYIFAKGLWRYLKEDTLIGSGIRLIKHKLNQIAEIDLSKPLNQTILKYVLINTGIVAVMITFWGFGYVLAIIYGFISFFWLKDKIMKIQGDYDKLLRATKELGHGNFEVEIDGDVGIFNALSDEFKNIRTGFETAVKEETKSQNMKNELVSNVSHDLKTPLTCIKNYIVLLQDDQLEPATRSEYLNNLNQYANRLNNLIEDLFEVSKVNSGNIKLDMMELNLIALIEQVRAECSEVLDSRHLSVITNYPSPVINLQLDGDKTYRVFENLLTNISKYALSDSRVYIDIQEDDENVRLTFKNISQEQMNFKPQDITERFVRGDKSRHESGSGLGLAIAKSFVEAQGGKFEIAIDGDLFKAIITFKKIA